MFKKSLMLAVSGAALIAATNANAFLDRSLVHYDVEEIQTVSYEGDTFARNLAREYKEFASYEAYQMYDWIDAEHFAQKAKAANAGKDVQPEQVADWNIPEEHVNELTSARGRLVNALANGGTTKAPEEAAEAQVRYDCWMEQQEENHQWAHIAACKKLFFAALGNLENALRPKQVTTTTTETGKMATLDQAAVYFEFDKATLTNAAISKIDSFANGFANKNDIELRVVGHADTAGPSDYNRNLSQRRAQAVAEALRSRGMRVADIEQVRVIAKGESDPAVKTGDGVPEQANRRVEVTAHADQTYSYKVKKQTAINPRQ